MNITSHIQPHLLFILVCALLCVPSLTFAATYTVSPLVIDHELEKRDIVKETITITNTGSSMLRIYPTVNEIAVDEGGKVETFVEPSMQENRATAITSWIEISRARLELKPGESKELPISIRVHPEVASGEYHAFVGFPDGSNRPEAEKKVYQGSVPGTVVRIGVDKVQNQFLRLEHFSVDRFVNDKDGSPIRYILINPGDDPVVPKGEIIIYDNSGIEVASVPVNEPGAAIEGNKQMEFQGTIPEDIAMGKYKAFLSVEYGENLTASVHDTAFFYVLPVWNIVVIFVLVLAVAIGIALFVHHKYDLSGDTVGADDVAMYIREGRSERKDHDIDLSKKGE